MLRIRQVICIFLMALLLAQPVFAETEGPTAPPEPDIVTAVYPLREIPDGLTTAPLYTMADDGSWTPVLARALPEDVTQEYAGTYGIPDDAQRFYAFRILLNGDACWEDGVLITADDYISSIRRLFQSEETAGDWTFLANAEAIRAGKAQPGSQITSLRDAGYSGVSEAWSAGYRDFYVDTDGFWGLDGGWMSVSDRTRLRDFAMPGGLDECFVSPAYLYSNYLMDDAQSSYYQSEFIGICRTPGQVPNIHDLGLLKADHDAIILILEDPSTASMLMQQLESLRLFREGSASFFSYGPYRVVSENDTAIVLESNPNWWGPSDPRDYDRILCQKIGS